MARKRIITPEKKELIRNLISEYNITSAKDLQEALKDLLGDTIQNMLEAELDEHLGYEKYESTEEAKSNYRNGYTSKTLKSSVGQVEIDIPRDRNAEFEPKIVPRYKRDISEIENKIIAMYARGMSTREINEQIQEIYGFEVSAEMVSKITDKILPEIEEWQKRPLGEVYPIVFIDAIHFSVKNDGIVGKKAVYIVLAIDIEGQKDVIGIYVGENESSKFWLSVLNDLKNRGVKDILILWDQDSIHQRRIVLHSPLQAPALFWQVRGMLWILLCPVEGLDQIVQSSFSMDIRNSMFLFWNHIFPVHYMYILHSVVWLL